MVSDNKSLRPTKGRLWYDGKVILENKPFAILQHKKKVLLDTGFYQKELFKITY